MSREGWADVSDWRGDHPVPGVTIYQPPRGFRYGCEPYWLTGFALEGGKPHRVLDLGTGSGIIPWLFASQHVEAWGLERVETWEPAWARSIQDSRVASPRFVVGDVMTFATEGRWDLVVSNPPFYPAGSGALPRDLYTRSAKFEDTASLADFIRVATSLARRVCVVLPTRRLSDLHGVLPNGWGVRRGVHVGDSRILVELRPGLTRAFTGVVAPRGHRVTGWYRRLGALPPQQ